MDDDHNIIVNAKVRCRVPLAKTHTHTHTSD